MAFLKIAGVYAINCTATKKVYIGSAISVRQRLACHKSMLERQAHTNKHLQNAYNKYGADSFVMEMLEACEPDERIAREQAWIDYYDASNPEYGMNNSATATTTTGFKHSPATKAKLSELAASREHSHLRAYAESLRGLPSWNKGIPGRKWTDDERQAASIQRRGKPAWNKGAQHKEETKKKISESASLTLTKYGSEIAEMIKRMRASGSTWLAISIATGVSLSQCNKIGRGLRTFESLKGAA